MTAEKSRRRSNAKRRRGVFLLIGGAALAGALVLGFSFWPAGPQSVHQAYALAPESALPANFRKAPPSVREAYRFAIANREILRQVPCYCGCGQEHQSNADCYIKSVKPDGQIEFDQMSFT